MNIKSLLSIREWTNNQRCMCSYILQLSLLETALADYGDFIMGTMVKAIHRWPVVSPHKGPVTRKMFLYDDAIMRTILPMS